MFGTALNYCVLRILGVPADDPRMVKARMFIQKLGKKKQRNPCGQSRSI